MVIFAIIGSSAYCRWLAGRELESAKLPLFALEEVPSEMLREYLKSAA
jgi:hypothetical protein